MIMFSNMNEAFDFDLSTRRFHPLEDLRGDSGIHVWDRMRQRCLTIDEIARLGSERIEDEMVAH